MNKKLKKIILLLCFLAMTAYVLTISGCGSGGGDTGTTGGFSGLSSNTGSTTASTPKISNCSPSNLTSGSILTVSGSGFGSRKTNTSNQLTSDTVSFIKVGLIKEYNSKAQSPDVLNATSYISWTDSQIVCLTPGLSPSEKYVVVVRTVSDDGSYTSPIDPISDSDIITAMPPTNQLSLASIDPNSNLIPGTFITISGTGFGEPDVSGNYIGFTNDSLTVAQVSFEIWSDTQIICEIPPLVSNGMFNTYVHNDLAGSSNLLSITVTAPPPPPLPTPTTGYGNVIGTVSDGSGIAMSGVTVSIGSITSTSDSNGNFQLLNVPSGSQTITAVFSGYYDYSNSISVIDSSSQTENITMIPNPGPSSYGFVSKWGTQGQSDGQFDTPYAIALDSSDNRYVADTNNNRIQKFDSSDNFIIKWGAKGSGDGQFDSPVGVAVDSSGNVYVADLNNNRIQKFDSSGNYITKWGTLGSENGQFSGPVGIAVDASNYVYVSDSLNNRVQKFDSAGNFVAKWGSLGSDNGQFANIKCVAVDSFGNVYVADQGNNRIQKFDSSGNFIAKWGTQGSDNGQFKDLHGITIDSSGNIFAGDQGNNRIQKFDSSGTYITKWGTQGSEDGQFSNLKGVAVDITGNVYVVDSGNNRIQVFAILLQ